MATLIEQLAPKETVERLEHSLAQDLPVKTDALFPCSAKKIREGAAFLDDVESFLQRVPSDLKAPLLQVLRLKKGWLLLRHDLAEELDMPLRTFDDEILARFQRASA